jgi:hypothetical protein
MSSNEEYKSILEELSALKTKLAVTDYFINNFKDTELNTIKKLDELKDRVSSLEIKIYNNFQDVERSTSDKINKLDIKITQLQNSIAPLNNNNFLQFTNTMDVKKWVALGSIVISILASAGVLDNFLSRNISEDELQTKIEQLIKLTE